MNFERDAERKKVIEFPGGEAGVGLSGKGNWFKALVSHPFRFKVEFDIGVFWLAFFATIIIGGLLW
jgi:hypothetical protein